MNRGDTWYGGLGRGMHCGLLPTGSEEREVLGVGIRSILVGTFPSCQDI